MNARQWLPKEGEERLPRRVTDLIWEVLLHSLKDRHTIRDLSSKPTSVERLRCLIGRATTSKGVADDLVRIRRNFDTPGGNHGLEFINMPARLEFLMASWGGIVPEIGQV